MSAGDIAVFDEDGSVESDARKTANNMTRDELVDAYAKECVENYGHGAYADACWAGARYSLCYENGEMPTEDEINERIQKWWDMCLPPKKP